MELELLHEFDQEVLAHPEDAQTYATNQFLDALTHLINQDAQSEDELKNVKDALRAFATVLPHVFKTVCQNEAETRMWQSASSLSDTIETNLVQHANTGLCINALKCIQVLVLLYSKPNDPNKKEDFSLTSVRQNHRLLDIAQLEEKGQSLLQVFLDMLKSDQTSVIFSAVVNCLVPIVKKRPQFRRHIIEALVNLAKAPPSNLSAVQKRSVEKIVKIALTTLIRTEQLSSYRNEFIAGFAAAGGNPAIFQSRQSRERERRENEESRRSKRSGGSAGAGAVEQGSEKRTKLSHHGTPPQQQQKLQQRVHTPTPPPPPTTTTTVPPPPPSQNGPNPLANFNATTLPLPIVIEICLAVLQSVPEQTIRERIDMLPPTGLMPNSNNQQQPLLPTQQQQPMIPVAPPPAAAAVGTPSQPPILQPPSPSSSKKHDRDQKIIEQQREAKRPRRDHNAVTAAADTKMPSSSSANKSHVPLASVQERASQSLKMQPYELAAPSTPNRDQQLQLLKMSVQRIFDAEYALQTATKVPANTATNPAQSDPSSNTAGTPPSVRAAMNHHPAKTTWLLLVAKLLTRGTAYTMPDQQQQRLIQQATTEANGSDTKEMNMKMALLNEEDSNSDHLKEMLVDFIVADLPSRHELAIEWLHEEFHCDTIRKRQLTPNDDGYEPTYFKWLQLLLQKGIPTLQEAKDKTLSKLMLDAPALNAESIDLIRRNMRENPARFVSCVSTLRDLVAHRPPVRQVCLNVLLDYCINRDVKMRSTSIVAVRKWVPDHPAIAPQVEAYAIQALQTLTQSGDDDDDENGQEKQDVEDEQGDTTMTTPAAKQDGQQGQEEEDEDAEAWKEQDVVRHAELFFALCAKKNDLLDELFNVYIHATEQVQRVIRQHIYNLIKSIGMNSAKLLDTIRHFPPGGETLVIRILVTLCDTVRPTPELVAAVKSVYQERNLDAKFLIPIVSGLSKEDLRHNLSKIVELLNNTDAQRKVVKKVFSRIVSSSATVAAPMTPTELLLALHEMEENVPLPKAVEAINICFTMPDTFEAKYVSAALRHLAEQPKIPILLMVTMIRTVSVYKSLVQFILQLLEKLIKKKVWTYPKLWDGFVKCTERTQPESVKMVANLPEAQLKDILLRIPSIQSPLREHAERNQLVKVLVLMSNMGLIRDEEDEDDEQEQQQAQEEQ
ncbi:Symplekin tight junction protein C terminal-domain-containing protein [Zychaea mexicana]|uniref:Symplekin tight junction protein C terminal-domain-containing protein n=1 Tax=Zychaea mexicana TaxID=64656 RepID=UPI0022FF1633|nr:Symplekin tight junction protein C terminal-domain-containing protein [Zychaea mexicana]KAI9495403.1 Symplekin tight junction protein C terminal-domain-containing protein [Zychaea mexicana]